MWSPHEVASEARDFRKHLISIEDGDGTRQRKWHFLNEFSFLQMSIPISSTNSPKISYNIRSISHEFASWRPHSSLEIERKIHDCLYTSSIKHAIRHFPRGGWGYSTHFYAGRLRPGVQPLTLLYTIFHEKGTPFVYLLLTIKWYLFHIPCLEFYIPFNCCKSTVF